MTEHNYSNLTPKEYLDLEEARKLEEHHRALMNFWQLRRQRLEEKLRDVASRERNLTRD